MLALLRIGGDLPNGSRRYVMPLEVRCKFDSEGMSRRGGQRDI